MLHRRHTQLTRAASAPAAVAASEGSLGAALAKSAAERLVRACGATVGHSLPPGSSSADAVAAYLRRGGARGEEPTGCPPEVGGPSPPPHHHLPRALVAKELGLRPPPQQALLQTLIAAARKAAAEGAVSVPGWLGAGVGSQEELTAACARVQASMAAQRALEEAEGHSSGPAGETTPGTSGWVPPLEIDSDEDIPGALARVGAFHARAHTIAKSAGENAAELVKEAHKSLFSVAGGGGEGLSL